MSGSFWVKIACLVIWLGLCLVIQPRERWVRPSLFLFLVVAVSATALRLALHLRHPWFVVHREAWRRTVDISYLLAGIGIGGLLAILLSGKMTEKKNKDASADVPSRD